MLLADTIKQWVYFKNLKAITDKINVDAEGIHRSKLSCCGQPINTIAV